MKKELYLFDFDGTLTNNDTLFDFLKYSNSNYKWGVFLHAPLFALAQLKLMPKGKVKERFISFFFKGIAQSELEHLAIEYFEDRYESILRPNFVKYIQNLPEDADKYIVSASMDFWLKPFADYLGLKLISTKGEFEQGFYTGKFDGENCNYEEKVNRIKEEIDLSQYDMIKAFGDSAGDTPMLNLAHKKFFDYF